MEKDVWIAVWICKFYTNYGICRALAEKSVDEYCIINSNCCVYAW